MSSVTVLRGQEIEGGLAANKNYILNPSAHKNTSGWAVYADAAASTPVDGTGGSPTITFTRSTSSPLRGVASFVYTSLGTDQGEGASYDFSIDPADQARVISISFDYLPNANYQDGRLALYIYDVTNGVLIQPAGYSILDSTVINKHVATFQTSSNSTSYRLILHKTVGGFTGFEMTLDNFYVGPQITAAGAAITDPASYIPVITTGSGTMTNYTATAKQRRVGSDIEVTGSIAFSGAVGTWSQVYVALPSGLTVDEDRLGPTNQMFIGQARLADTGVANYIGIVRYLFSTNLIEIIYSNTNTSDAGSTSDPAVANGLTQAAPFAFASGDFIDFDFKLPIVGWSSNTVMSSDTDTRVVAARASRNGSNQTGFNSNSSAVKVNINSVSGINDFDSHGAFDTTNSRYVVSVPGRYDISATVSFLSTNVLNNRHILMIYKNGSEAIRGNDYVPPANTALSVSGSGVLNLVAGDYIEVYVFGAGNNSVSTLTVDGNNAPTHFNIRRLSGPSTIAASETVAARVTSTDTTSVAGGGNGTLVWNGTTYDTHGAVASNKFTAPVSGRYRMSASVLFNASANTVNQYLNMQLRKNGSTTFAENLFVVQTTSSIRNMGYISDTVYLNAGDYVEVRIDNQRTSAAVQNGFAANNYWSIERIGN
jgi:hypothetical protein